MFNRLISLEADLADEAEMDVDHVARGEVEEQVLPDGLALQQDRAVQGRRLEPSLRRGDRHLGATERGGVLGCEPVDDVTFRHDAHRTAAMPAS